MYGDLNGGSVLLEQSRLGKALRKSNIEIETGSLANTHKPFRSCSMELHYYQ